MGLIRMGKRKLRKKAVFGKEVGVRRYSVFNVGVTKFEKEHIARIHTLHRHAHLLHKAYLELVNELKEFLNPPPAPDAPDAPADPDPDPADPARRAE